MAWPLITAPNVPATRVSEMRRAFAETMQDAEFMAKAVRLGLDIDPIQGADMAAIVRRVSGYDAATIQRAQELGGP
jgi:hypothetical protein